MTGTTVRLSADIAWPVHSVARTREIEHSTQARIPPNTLMQRAGWAVARLARALAPHARTCWVACGPGNNGGDGLEAAAHLQAWGWAVTVTHLAPPKGLPPDAQAALRRAQAAGVRFSEGPPDDMTPQDLAIDALLGIGTRGSLTGPMAAALNRLAKGPAPVLSVDVPSGLDADNGQFALFSGAENPENTKASTGFCAENTLTLLTIKPGLLTGTGRDAAGTVWFNDLGIGTESASADAFLTPTPHHAGWPHAAHKGARGDVAVVGGASGMTGAALLAASAALYAGAGRVFVGLLDPLGPAVAPQQPELMFRPLADLENSAHTWVCGCGGGTAVRAVLPAALGREAPLVLDADALNAIAADTKLRDRLRQRGLGGRLTVLTPHPLEAARLCGRHTADVQADRLSTAHNLAASFHSVVVLKGSGTVVAAPGQTPWLNPTGNGRLGTAGSGDVLAGWLGARLAALGANASLATVQRCAADVVHAHGALADQWPAPRALTAQALARAIAT